MNSKQVKRAERKLAPLTTAQKKRWEQLFSIAVGSGAADDEADREAWKGLCEEWPDLRRFDGAL